MAGIPKDVWYADGLRFQCTQCGDCCTGAEGYVWVNQAEIDAMAARLGMTPADFEAAHVYRVGIRRSLKHRAIVMVLTDVAVSLFLNSLTWWLRWAFLAAVAIGLYVIWSVPTLPDDAPKAPRTISG